MKGVIFENFGETALIGTRLFIFRKFEPFVSHMTQWGLNFNGRLRVTAINHRLADGTRNEFYYIKERIKVTVHVDIFQGGEWEPLPADFDAWQDHDRYFSVSLQK